MFMFLCNPLDIDSTSWTKVPVELTYLQNLTLDVKIINIKPQMSKYYYNYVSW